MSGYILHQSLPQQKKSQYGEFDTVDFNIDVGVDRVLVKNSVALLGDLSVLDNGVKSTANIHLDPRCGIHAVVDSVQVSMSGSQKEHVGNYARIVGMSESALSAPEDALNAKKMIELKTISNTEQIEFCKGRTTLNSGAKLTNDQDFVMKPYCCLNKMSGADLPYAKSGTIRLSLNLAPNRSALMGLAYNPAQDSYELRNLRLIYESLPAPAKDAGQTVMRTVYNTKNSIQSNFSNVQVKADVVSDAVSISFQKQSREQTGPHSNYKMEKPRGIERIEFNFNNNINEFITYPLEDPTEIQKRFIQSFVDTGHARGTGDHYNDNQNYGVGLSLNSFIDFSDKNFGVAITSKANNTFPYNVYCYFHGIIAV